VADVCWETPQSMAESLRVDSPGRGLALTSEGADPSRPPCASRPSVRKGQRLFAGSRRDGVCSRFVFCLSLGAGRLSCDGRRVDRDRLSMSISSVPRSGHSLSVDAPEIMRFGGIGLGVAQWRESRTLVNVGN